MTGLLAQALSRFQTLLRRARASGLPEPTAVTLATADQHGRPSSRTVLLKEADARGFVLYTNLESRKARQLLANPRASLCFFWQPLMEQVMIEGPATVVTGGEADAYWATRDRRAQLGAWASLQSRPLNSRAALLARVARYAAQFARHSVPRPPHWSGFRIVPERIEFWSSRPHRLHERVVYEQRGGRWTKQLLYP